MLFKRFVMSLTTIQFRACPACWTWVEGRVRMCIPVNLVPPSSHRDSQTLSCEIYFRKHKITFGNNDLAHVVEILHGVKDKDPFIMHSQCHGCWHIEAKTKWLPFHRQRFQMHCLNENVKIWIQISLKFVLKGLITIIPALVWIMAWHRPGNKPLSELMMVKSLTHIYVTRPQWVNDWVTQGAGHHELRYWPVFLEYLDFNTLRVARVWCWTSYSYTTCFISFVIKLMFPTRCGFASYLQLFMIYSMIYHWFDFLKCFIIYVCF